MSETRHRRCPHCNLYEQEEKCVLKTVHNTADEEKTYCCENLTKKGKTE